MNVREKYIQECTAAIHKMHPEFKEDEIEKIVAHHCKKKYMDPYVVMENQIVGSTVDISLSKLCGWIENANPVVSGNATFYCQPKDLESPTSNMLKSLKAERKSIKKDMFSKKPGSDEYQNLDLSQVNVKVIMNAEYGASGTPTAAFYNIYGPAATTLMAQSIITTMAAFFEGYVGNNYKFFHVNECFDWMLQVCNKHEKIPEWIHRPTPTDVIHQINGHFVTLFKGDMEKVNMFIEHCNSDELTYLYYANNFRDLIDLNPKIQKMLEEILTSLPYYEASEKEIPEAFKDKFNDPEKDNLQEYNKWVSKEMFLDPNSPPKCIEKPLKEFNDVMTQFVYVEYITPDSIIKLNNHKRNTVLLVDTDSNMLNANLFVSFVLNEIFKGETFGRKKMYNEMIMVNTLAYALATGVGNILDYYGRCHHADDESRKQLTMKNEFMFRRFFLMKTKKRYAASIVLREGNIIIPFKPEIKGMDFIKAGVTDSVSERFEKMLCDHILFSDEIELHELMKDIKGFEKEIYDDLMNGGTKYLKQQQFKDTNGYKDEKSAWALPQYRGSIVWNELFDKKITSLDRVHVLKLAVAGVSDLEKIHAKYPKEYSQCVEKIFMNQKNEVVKSGMKYICIPVSVKKIPDWIIPLINHEVIISDTISVFRSILKALDLEEMEFKTPNGNASITSCLISL